MEKITYVGLERCDYIYHLANILSLQGSVLVIDNSYNLDLIDAVSTTGTREIREWRNIVYAYDIDLQLTDVSAYDYVLLYAGMAFEASDFENDTLTLVMPDYTHTALQTLVDKLPSDLSNPIFILRDQCSKKLTNKSIAQMLDIPKKNIVGYIPVNTTDMAAYVTLTHNHYANIRALSEDMYEALNYVIAKLFDVEGDKRKLDRIMKEATKLK